MQIPRLFSISCSYTCRSPGCSPSSVLTHADPPAVRLEVGKALNLNDLEEGDDVYFECSVTANPAPYKVTWLHNVSIVFPLVH
jgi:hypothetical protein